MCRKHQFYSHFFICIPGSWNLNLRIRNELGGARHFELADCEQLLGCGVRASSLAVEGRVSLSRSL